MDPVATERLWLTQPRRSTCLARVVAVRGDKVAFDRSLFAPASHAHRHPQPHDTGTVWVEGEKRRMDRAFLRDGTLWHHIRGRVPAVGAALNCQLDQDRRERASRAHTAMHLLIAAVQGASGPALAGEPSVKGGGTFRLEFATRHIPAPDLAAWLARANTWVQEDHKVSVEHVLRELAARALDVQRFDPPHAYPGPDLTIDAVRIEGVCAYPCDGTHVERTGRVGRIVISQAHASAGRFVVVGRVG
ncbi:MAG: hypothetical protein V4510_07165 [bacterium]